MKKRLTLNQLYCLETIFGDFDLEHAFKEFNSKYFHFGKKKLATLLGVEWEKRLDSQNLMAATKTYRSVPPRTYKGKKAPDTVRIVLNPKYKKERRVWMLTLLHEMAHFKLVGVDKGRGRCDTRLFTAEMKRLANAGALRGLW